MSSPPYGRLVRAPLSFDDVEDLELAAETPEQHRAAAARLVAWSEEPHPEDDAEVTPAMLLAHAGEMLTTVGDHEDALDLYRRAAAAEGDVVPDVRCHLHQDRKSTPLNSSHANISYAVFFLQKKK